jgi:hypothetical protein
LSSPPVTTVVNNTTVVDGTNVVTTSTVANPTYNPNWVGIVMFSLFLLFFMWFILAIIYG